MDMTKLDELIKEQRDAAQKYLDAISRIDPFVYCDDDEVMDEKEETLRYIANHHNEIADHLEELKTTRKALEFACDILGDLDESNCDSQDWMRWLLEKAGESNE